MIKFLFENFRDFPVVGTPITIAYVGSLVQDVVKEGKRSQSAKDLSTLTGDELEGALNDEANSIFDEQIMPQINSYNLPSAVVTPIKEKAVEKIVAALREKIGSKIENKAGIGNAN